MRKTLERLWESAIDTALQTLWIALAGVFMTLAVALWARVVGLSAHTLDRIVGCLFGIILVLVVNVVLTGVRLRRTHAQERLRQSLHASKEKGFLDFVIQRDEAGAQFHKAVSVLVGESNNLAKQAYSTKAKFDALAGVGRKPTPKRGRKIAAAMAKALHKSCGTLERKIADADGAVDLFMESHIGYLQWQLSNAGVDPAGTATMRAEAANLVAIAQRVITGQRDFKKTLDSLRGVSQELNTAINRLAAALDATISLMQKVEEIGHETMRIIDKASTAVSATSEPH